MNNNVDMIINNHIKHNNDNGNYLARIATPLHDHIWVSYLFHSQDAQARYP